MRKIPFIAVTTLAMATALVLPALVFPTAALAAPLTWEKVNQDGFGFSPPGEMGSALCMAEYNGHLYAGTVNYENANGAAVWRYDGGTDWTQVASGGFGNAANEAVFCLEVYNGLLYAGTMNQNGCEVWSYDGTGWAEEVGAAGSGDTSSGFGDGTACTAAGDMIVFNDMLYVGAGWGTGAIAQIWAFDGAGWTQVNTDDFGNVNNSITRSFAVYGGKLYAGTNNENDGCGVWRYDGPDPTNWTQVNTDGFEPGGNNDDARSMQVWNGRLYVGVAVDIAPCDVWAYDGTSWSDVTPTLSDPGNTYSARSMAVYKGDLFLGTGDYEGAGCQVYRYHPDGSSEQVNTDGFGDPLNQAVHSLCEFQGDLYAGVFNVDWEPTEIFGGAQVYRTNVPSTWYLAEGSTDGGMETWVLVQNPNPDPVTVDIDFMTGSGPVPGPQDYNIPANSRESFKVSRYVTDYKVSTMVVPTGGDVICERAMYGNDRAWAHDSIGVTSPSSTWYLAEGSTDGGMETWVLVQNPNPDPVTVDLNFMTGSGPVPGPQDYNIPANSRESFKVNETVTDYKVSTMVTSTGGPVICERAMYGNDRAWAHDSIGVTSPSSTWYLAEGSTDGGMETWVLVQNPNSTAATVDVNFMTGSGPVPGPQNVNIPANSRESFKVNDTVTDYKVSTMVTSDIPVICERAMYGNDRTWAHDSIGVTAPEYIWYLAEGSTDGGMETWVLVQNPNPDPVTVDVDFMTGSGPVPGPQNVNIPANSRESFKVNDTVTDYKVSTMVTSDIPVICERAMYGNDRAWAHDSIGYTP